MLQKIQVRLLMNYGMPVRGSITLGEFYVNDDIVFGEGLVKAVTLEEKFAKNPRVIIDKEVFEIYFKELIKSNLIVKDVDGACFVNYFENEDFLMLTKGKCESLINRYCKYHYAVKDQSKINQTERTITKYIWLLMYFNSQCEYLDRMDLEINYKLSINERILKVEICCGKMKLS